MTSRKGPVRIPRATQKTFARRLAPDLEHRCWETVYVGRKPKLISCGLALHPHGRHFDPESGFSWTADALEGAERTVERLKTDVLALVRYMTWLHENLGELPPDEPSPLFAVGRDLALAEARLRRLKPSVEFNIIFNSVYRESREPSPIAGVSEVYSGGPSRFKAEKRRAIRQQKTRNRP